MNSSVFCVTCHFLGMHVIACPDPRIDIAKFTAETPHILQDSNLENFDASAWRFLCKEG